MTTVIDCDFEQGVEQQLPADGLFQVWVDVYCGTVDPPDWWWNSEPKSLPAALNEAAECRNSGFPAKIMPQGHNPRPDGRWSDDG